jgi:hypothetical protein
MLLPGLYFLLNELSLYKSRNFIRIIQDEIKPHYPRLLKYLQNFFDNLEIKRTSQGVKIQPQDVPQSFEAELIWFQGKIDIVDFMKALLSDEIDPRKDDAFEKVFVDNHTKGEICFIFDKSELAKTFVTNRLDCREWKHYLSERSQLYDPSFLEGILAFDEATYRRSGFSNNPDLKGETLEIPNLWERVKDGSLTLTRFYSEINYIVEIPKIYVSRYWTEDLLRAVIDRHPGVDNKIIYLNQGYAILSNGVFQILYQLGKLNDRSIEDIFLKNDELLLEDPKFFNLPYSFYPVITDRNFLKLCNYQDLWRGSERLNCGRETFGSLVQAYRLRYSVIPSIRMLTYDNKRFWLAVHKFGPKFVAWLYEIWPNVKELDVFMNNRNLVDHP